MTQGQNWWLPGSLIHALLGPWVPEGPASKLGFASQLVLDSKDMIVLGHAPRSARGTSFHLPSTEPHHHVNSESVLSLPRSMGHHDTPATGLVQLTCLPRLSHRAYLVHFEQDLQDFLPAALTIHLGLVTVRLFPHYLDARTSCELLPSVPVILVKGVFNDITG